MSVRVEARRGPLSGIDDNQGFVRLKPLEAGIGGVGEPAPFGLGSGQDEVEQDPILLQRIIEERKAAIAMAEQPQ